MEVMEDGNLMDKVNILIQRDMEYYTKNQTILQETICAGIIGGKLDFPRSASFASVKLVLWWEKEFEAAHKKPSGFLPKSKCKKDTQVDDDNGGIVKDSDPSKFVSLIVKSADQLLAHLHVLTQEALDHADLAVLTGTIGASALLKNCLWFYIRAIKDEKTTNVENLQTSYKKYHEMCEALAERLLDLHCRLISLYILQDAECLDWEDEKPFFESERGSYTIQMWWLYMQGYTNRIPPIVVSLDVSVEAEILINFLSTKEDLWSTVPPRMAQRVFGGMLNESLTILTVRYTQGVPSETRNQLIVVDISNVLMCIAELLPALCDNAKELTGTSYNTGTKILRDIHTKCQELYTCLLLRAAPIDILNKVFHKGLDIEMCKSKTSGIAPWMTFAQPNIFDKKIQQGTKIDDLNPDIYIALELTVLLSQPQLNWAQLLKVLCMNKYKILQIILSSMREYFTLLMEKPLNKNSTCSYFLCNEEGSCGDENVVSGNLQAIHYYNLILSSTEILLFVGNKTDLMDILLPLIIEQPNWAYCLERRHVWNQIRPAWYEAILNFTTEILPIVADTVIHAIQTEATMYQGMSIILACVSQFWDYINPTLYRISSLLQEHILADIVPLNNSTLVQILVCSIYSYLLRKSREIKKEVRIEEITSMIAATNNPPEAIALAVAESLCSIDEDNKHTNQIDEFLSQVKSYVESEVAVSTYKRLEENQIFAEVAVSEILASATGKNSLKMLYWFVKCNADYIYKMLGVNDEVDDIQPQRGFLRQISLLHTMFNINSRPFDQLLSGKWQPNWLKLLQNPMGISKDRIWKQISQRWEFRNTSSTTIPPNTILMVNNITSSFK